MPNKKNKSVAQLFDWACRMEYLVEVLQLARQGGYDQKPGVKICRKFLLQLLRNTKYRETTVPGSTFDLVQQKLDREREIEDGLKNACQRGLSWDDAVFELHIGYIRGEEYRRLNGLFRKMRKKRSTPP